ncbi:hypothetical protein LXA43DRAFT_396625 [Ganoderma leucocontextum]|nr:hypothetical protein LXA43DRAFT_396625 [Ganoderma leucocontextum]
MNILEHADDFAEPRRRKRPTRAGRSPSPDPPPRDEVLQCSRFFGAGSRGKGKEKERRTESADRDGDGDGDGDGDDDGEATVTLTGPGSRDAMKEFARTIGLSPPRATAIEIPDSDGEGSDEDAFVSAPKPINAASRPLDVARAKAKTAQKAQDHDKDKDKDKGKEVIFGAEPSSDDYGFDFEMDDSFLEFVSRAEKEGLRGAAAGGPTNVNGKSSTTTRTQTQTQTQVGTQPQAKVQVPVNSQATSATLFSLGGATAMSTSSTVRGRVASRKNTPTIPGTSAPGSRATSVLHTSSSHSIPIAKRNAGAATGSMNVIDISEDEEEIDKENVPVPTRHVRRRVARQADADVIELSD